MTQGGENRYATVFAVVVRAAESAATSVELLAGKKTAAKGYGSDGTGCRRASTKKYEARTSFVCLSWSERREAVLRDTE